MRANQSHQTDTSYKNRLVGLLNSKRECRKTSPWFHLFQLWLPTRAGYQTGMCLLDIHLYPEGLHPRHANKFRLSEPRALDVHFFSSLGGTYQYKRSLGRRKQHFRILDIAIAA